MQIPRVARALRQPFDKAQGAVVAFAVVLTLLLAASSTVAGPPVEWGELSARAAPLGTAFTYQGRLTDEGNPASGIYDFQFQLHDAVDDGSQVGSTVTQEDVVVADGLFTVELDFGSGVFTGDARWLEMGVRPGDSTGAYTILTPRHALTPVPYALYALRAPWAGLTGIPAGFADGVDDDTTYVAGTGLELVGTTFSADTTYLQRRVSDSCAGGNAIRVINEDGTVTCEPVGLGGHDHWGQAWSGSGVGLTLNSSNDVGLQISSDDDGIVLYSPGEDGMYVESAGDDGVYVVSPGDDGFRVDSPGNNGVYIDSPGGSGVWVNSPNWTGVSVFRPGIDGFEVQYPADDGVFVYRPGADGINVVQPGDDGVYVSSPGGDGVQVDDAGDDGVAVYRPGRDGIDVFNATRYGVYADTNATYGFYTNDKIYAGDGYVDIAEHIDAASDVEPGDVVVIDPDHDERVVKSTKPYDTSVAGIISTDPALLIGKSDTETPLALAGRVPCKVSAENGPIHRGDLLTTSSTPGHAMKATEPQLGTIVGKALGELESGTGVIPVLVTLQ